MYQLIRRKLLKLTMSVLNTIDPLSSTVVEIRTTNLLIENRIFRVNDESYLQVAKVFEIETQQTQERRKVPDAENQLELFQLRDNIALHLKVLNLLLDIAQIVNYVFRILLVRFHCKK